MVLFLWRGVPGGFFSSLVLENTLPFYSLLLFFLCYFATLFFPLLLLFFPFVFLQLVPLFFFSFFLSLFLSFYSFVFLSFLLSTRSYKVTAPGRGRGLETENIVASEFFFFFFKKNPQDVSVV